MSVPSSTSQARGRAQDRHRWRGSPARRGGVLTELWRHRRRFTWGLLLTAAVLLFVWLVGSLLFAPTRTPLLVFSSAPYSWPLPPNAWSQLDTERLKALDGKSVTLLGADQPVRTRDGLLQRLSRDLAIDDSGSTGTRIVFLSLHGLAESADGPAFLIPGEASPVDPATWVAVDELLSMLADSPARKGTLLVLDCHRIPANWNLGLTKNRFSENVQRAFAELSSEKLAILMSAAPRQYAEDSADLQGSVFGVYLRQGLAGAADRETGDADGWVSLTELHDYVATHVANWVAKNRGQIQTPVLLRGDATSDFRLTRSLNGATLNRFLADDRKVRRASPSIPAEELDNLWRQLEQWKPLGLYRAEPIAWRDLEHRLLSLEQLAVSGPSYRDLAKRKLADTKAEMQQVATRLAAAQESGAVGDRCTIISGRQWPVPTATPLHSLPLARYFGLDSADEAISTSALLAPLTDLITPQNLRKTLDAIDENESGPWRAARFLRMIDRYQTPSHWDQPADIRRLLSAQQVLNEAAVPFTDGAVLGDERSHHWTRRFLAVADENRRATEDHFFHQHRPRLQDRLDQLESSRQQALRQSESVVEIFGRCDRAIADTPYLAWWATHPLRPVDATMSRELVNDQILPLIESAGELSRQLAALPDADAEQAMLESSLARLKSLADDQVSPGLRSLSDAYQSAQAALLIQSESNVATTVGEIDAALSVPLASWQRRRDLRQARERLEVRLHDDSLTSDDQRVTTSDSPAAAPFWSNDAEWKTHPFAALFAVHQPEASVQGNPARDFPGDIAQQLSQVRGADSIAQRRELCDVAARRCRAVASLWTPPLARDPIQQLRNLDLQSLLAWHAQLALTDFWGPAGEKTAFFEIAAASTIDLASQIGLLEDAEEASEITALVDQLAAAKRSQSRWIVTQPEPTVQIDPQNATESVVTVTSSQAGSTFPFPNGTATLMIRDTRGGRLDDVDFAPSDAVSLPAPATPSASGAAFDVAIGSLPELDDPSLRAETVFRGHEYGRRWQVDPLQGIKVEVLPHRYRHSEVTLSSPWDSLSVAFVLDCSQSMGETLDVTPEGASLTRLAVAKSALQEMLFALGMRQNIRAAVHLFGHRVGWSTDEPVRRLPRPGLPGPIGDDVSPSADVETILSLRDFNLSTAQATLPVIAGAEPWGQSPLYLTLTRALQEFDATGGSADRHIIVITDGANYQYIPADEFDVSSTSNADVRAAWQQSRIPIHILGLGMDRSEDQQAIEEFRQLCIDTGGGFRHLNSATDLNNALRELLNAGAYQLHREGASETEDVEASLGKRVRLTPAPPENTPFLLSHQGRPLVDPQSESGYYVPFAQESLVLDGGESLQLFVSQQGDLIHAFPYDKNVAVKGELLDEAGRPTDHLVRIHRPQMDQKRNVTFPVSWQQYDARVSLAEGRWRVTQRPPKVWVEIQPVTQDGSDTGQAYVFFDRNYEPESPVPLMRFVASDWPRSAAGAHVRVACRPPGPSAIELSPPSSSDLLPAPLADQPQGLSINESLNSPLSLSVSSGVSLRRLPVRQTDGSKDRKLTFVLTFEDPSVDVASLKLDVRSEAHSSPIRVVRQFDTVHRLAVHTFTFEPAPTKLPTELIISTREHEHSGAWSLGDPGLKVDVSQPGMFLPVSNHR